MGLPVQLQENEKVVRIIKRHPLSLIGRMVGVAMLLLLGGALWVWLRSFGGGLEVVLDILIGVGALIAIVYAGVYWYRYENDLWIVTSERLIDSTKTTPLTRRSRRRRLPTSKISTFASAASSRQSSSTAT
jgi:hypothetical protein